MKHKTYRICLLSLVIIAVIGGILIIPMKMEIKVRRAKEHL